MRPLLLGFVFCFASLAQIVGNAPPDFRLDGSITEWEQRPPTVVYTQSQFARYWIASSTEGLVLAGSAVSPIPSPAGPIEVWISTDDHVEMPAIDIWSSGAGLNCDTPHASEAAKQFCVEWIERQKTYREKLLGLFTRTWRLGAASIQEIYATPRYESLTVEEKADAAILKPQGQPVVKFVYAPDGNRFTFEILVPWECLPPQGRLSLERIRMAINIVEDGSDAPNRIAASTQPSRTSDLPESLRVLTLASPKALHFTPCEYPLATANGDPIYALIAASGQVRAAFTFANSDPCCGAISMPSVGSLSPVLKAVEHRVERLSANDLLCDPPLVYRRGNSLRRFDLELEPGSGFLGAISKKLEVRRLLDGTRLLMDGPVQAMRRQSYTMCSACPWFKFSIFALRPSGEIVHALELSARTGDGVLAEYNLEVSPDWRVVTEFKRSGDQHWQSNRFCLAGFLYKACGVDDQAQAPRHGLLPLTSSFRP